MTPERRRVYRLRRKRRIAKEKAKQAKLVSQEKRNPGQTPIYPGHFNLDTNQ